MLENKPDPITNPIVSYPYRKLFQTSFYRMHKYWGRKPPNVVAKYIENYCPEGGVVLDPFLGSGTTAFEAIRTGRKVIGIDINPLAIFITKTTLSPVRLASLENAFYKVVSDVSETTKSLFRTKCTKCNEPATISFLMHKTDSDNSFEMEKPEKVIYQCKCSKDNLYKDPGKLDFDLNNECKRLNITKWYPKKLILPTIRQGKGEAKTIYDLYTNRNLYILSEIYASIIKNSTGMIRDCLLLSFSSSLPQSSRLSGIMKRRRNKIDAMGWILPSFRIMREHVEKNPLETFRLAFKRILNGKVETNSIFTKYSEGKDIKDVFNDSATAYIKQGSVNDLPKIIENFKVNYVFTDPPHGSSIQYLKLSKLSNAWLKLDIDEAPVVEQSGTTKEAEKVYLNKLSDAFNSIRKILNRDVCMHVYQRGKTRDWTSSSAAIVSGGFKIKNAIFQPQRYGFRTTYRGRGGVMKLTSPPGDWLLHFEPEIEKHFANNQYQQLEDDIVDGVKEIISSRGQPTRTKYLLANLANKIPSKVYQERPNIINEILNKYEGVIFEKTDRGPGRASDELWSIKDFKEESNSLDERVEKAIIDALVERDEFGASLPFLHQSIYSKFRSLLTPDQITIEKALIKIADEKRIGTEKIVFLKDEYIEKKKRQIELTIALLKNGIEEGFNVYIRPKELKRIKDSDLATEFGILVQQFPNMLLPNNYFSNGDSAIKQSNVLWIKNDYVRAYFEIKYKPDMPEKTIRRGEIIRRRWPESERVIVIPKKKEKALRNVLFKESSFWHVAPFHSILQSSDPKTYMPFEATEERYPAKAKPLKLEIIDKQDIRDSKNNIVSFKIVVKCPQDVLRRVKPGHFLKLGINNANREELSKNRAGNDYVVVRNSPNCDHKNLEYFRIPISIHSVYYENFKPSAFKNRSIDFLPSIFWEWLEPGEMKYLDLLIRIAGNGTKTLHNIKKGDTIDAIGPLGKAIQFPPNIETVILVSGGVGLASLYPIAYYFRERGRRVILFAGAYDKLTLMDHNGKLLPEFQEMGVECKATDEINDKKLVTNLLSDWVRSEPQNMDDKLKIYVCGPWPMLKSVHEIASKSNYSCTVLADKLMLCGIGACMTCVVKCKNKISGDIEMVRSCLDGPAFESTDIVWD